MKKKIISIISIAAIAVLGNSCKKIVEVGDSPVSITTEKTFTTDGTAYAALAGLYSYMLNGTSTGDVAFGSGAMTVYAGLSSDELINYLGAGNDVDYTFSINNLNSRNNIVNGLFWTPLYKNIFNANSIIEGIAASTSNLFKPAARKQINAEAKFFRAYYYFYLVNLFGDVPLLTTTDWKSNAQMSRTPSAQVYQQIVQDLIEAQADLTEDYAMTNGERIRVNRYAATAMLARVYLYLKDYKNAELQSTKVISNAQYILESNLDNVFLAASKENIWMLKPAAANANIPSWEALAFRPQISWEKDISAAEKPLYLDQSIFPDYSYLFYPNYFLSRELSASFETGDKRLKSWTSYVETPTYSPYTGVTDRYPTKYARQGSGVAQYLVVLRLAEQVLIRAEARAQQDNLSGADEDLNKIRNRAGLTPISSLSKESSLNAIAHERRTELFAEWGHRWLDLKRTGKAMEALKLQSYKIATANQLLYPIPQDELEAAPGLVQNPGY